MMPVQKTDWWTKKYIVGGEWRVVRKDNLKLETQANNKQLSKSSKSMSNSLAYVSLG